MTALQAILLGIIQGIGEFLPISSSGHLIFLPKLFGWQDQGRVFDMVLHLGTLVAVIFYFRIRIAEMLKSLLRKEKKYQADRRLVILIIVSTIPAAVLGFFLGDIIDAQFRTPQTIGIGLIVWGIVLGFADRYSEFQKKKRKDTSEKDMVKEMSWWQATSMGCAQALALIPGASRSGVTMSAGLFSGLTRKAAVEFSFLMSIPIIGLAAGAKLLDAFQHGMNGMNIYMLLIGFLSAMISGFFAISFLMKIIQKWSFLPFVVYRIIIGIIIIILL